MVFNFKVVFAFLVSLVAKLIWLQPFNRNSRKTTVEKDPNSTSVDSAIQIIEQNPDIESQFSSISIGLHYIQGFLTSARYWSAADESSWPRYCKNLGDVVSCRIEDSFETAGADIRNAIGKGDAELLNAVQCKLQKMILLSKVRIRKAYYEISKHHYQFEDWNRENRRTRRTCLELIKKIKEYFLDYEEPWKSTRRRLKYIDRFVKIYATTCYYGKGVRFQKVKDVVESIKKSDKMFGKELKTTIEEGNAEGLDALSTSIPEKTKVWKAMIREVYDDFLDGIFEMSPPCLPYTREDSLHEVGYLIARNAEGVLFHSWDGDDDDFRRDFNDIVYALTCFGVSLVSAKDYDKELRSLGVLVQWNLLRIGRILLLGWTEEMDRKEVFLMISDLLQRTRPTCPKILALYMRYIMLHVKHDLGQVAIIILPSTKSTMLLDGLKYLLQSKHVEILRSDIEKLVSHATSFSYSYLVAAHDDDQLLFQLLQKIELFKLELIFTSPKSIAFESVYTGLSSVQTFLIKAPDVYSKSLVFICKHMEQMAVRVQSLDQSSLQVKSLHIGFKLIKIKAILMEQMRCSPCLMPLFHDRIQTLNQGLDLLFKHFSALPTENQGDEQLILTYMQTLDEDKTLPYCFSKSDQVPQHFINQLSDYLTTMQRKINLMNSDIQDNVSRFQSSLELTFPITHTGLGFADIFLEKLSGLMHHRDNSIGVSMKHHIEQVSKELGSLTSFQVKVGKRINQLKNIWGRVSRAVYEAEYLIDWILVVKWDWNRMLWLSIVIDDMKALNQELTSFFQMENDSPHVFEQVSVTQISAPRVVVFLEDQESIIISRLTRAVSQRREIVTISGMPGLGKTTLAKKVYEHHRIKNHFHVLAWCCVSQVYRKRELLLKILGDITKSNTDEMDCKTDDDLVDMLYKGLKGKRYCVVMDDVWSSQVWDELRFAFPDDKNGSRILITTRNKEVGLSVEPHSAPHTLRFLSEDESWKLLEENIFNTGGCPKDLFKVGTEIAKGCKGLPMAIIAIAGLLKTSKKNVELWEEIEKHLNSHILESPEIQCMHILELSYNHLPEGLKSCFLYFAAFGEDSEVPVQKLIQLWLAEGFVGEVNKVSPEEVAESYVINLVARSLLMAIKMGSSGRIKACKVHDMVYSLCLQKVEQEKFLKYINGYGDLFPSSNSQLDYGVDSEYPPVSIAYDQHRLSICSKRNQFVSLMPSGPYVRTLLFSAASDSYPRCPYDEISFITEKFKILSILDIECINIGSSFPKGIEMVYPLRYLAISGDIRSIPSTIAKLWNLESFVVKGLIGKVALPDTIWSMSKLRHLHVSSQAILSFKDGSLESSAQLDNMVSLSCPTFSNGDNSEDTMKLFPNLIKLRCTLSGSTENSTQTILFPVLDFLEKLESLRIIYYGSARHYCQIQETCFPENLNKLSLSHFRLTWNDFSAIGELPNLTILKLVSVAFDSLVWEMKEDEFQRLEYLKLDSVKIHEWRAESDHIPNLRQLVLRSCIRLEEVPSSFGGIATLEMVELKWCSVSAEMSVIEILEEQLGYGNDGFKAFINGFAADPRSSVEDSSNLPHVTDEVSKLKEEIVALQQKLKDQEELYKEKYAPEKSDD